MPCPPVISIKFHISYSKHFSKLIKVGFNFSTAVKGASYLSWNCCNYHIFNDATFSFKSLSLKYEIKEMMGNLCRILGSVLFKTTSESLQMVFKKNKTLGGLTNYLKQVRSQIKYNLHFVIK